MTGTYLYAVLGSRPRGRLGRGLSGEPLTVLEGPGLWAVTGAMKEPPHVAITTLRGHDAVVRALAVRVDALLPARFGSFHARDDLLSSLERHRAELGQALAVVDGCEQMTLRLYLSTRGGHAARHASPQRQRLRPAPGSGPGARYLMRRRLLARRAREVPELAPLRAALGALVRAERAERTAARQAPGAQLVASVYHLIPRGKARAYGAIVEAEAAVVRPYSVALSGPSPAYAFAPESHA
jgi:hypothetical protein